MLEKNNPLSWDILSTTDTLSSEWNQLKKEVDVGNSKAKIGDH